MDPNLPEPELLLEATFDAIPDPIAILDSQQRIIRVNQAMADRLCMSAGDCVGHFCFQAVHGSSSPPEACPHSRMTESGVSEMGEIHEPRLGGDFLVTTTPVRLKTGEVVACVHVARDITQRLKIETNLRRSEERLSLAAKAGNLGMWEWRPRESFFQVTPIWREITGFDPPAEGFTSEQWLDRIHPEDRENARDRLHLLLTGQLDHFLEELRIQHPKHGGVWLFGTGDVVERDEQDRPLRVIGFHQDITDRKRLESELTRLATTDPLTGICNRRAFTNRATQEFERSARYQRPLSLAILDIDHFKRVNDTFGHQAGDEVLQVLARTSLSVLRTPDVLGRWGGEEFAFLFPETDASAVIEACERLRITLSAATIAAGESNVNLTVSIGVTSKTTADKDIDDMLRRADRALYHAKAQGRNQVRWM